MLNKKIAPYILIFFFIGFLSAEAEGFYPNITVLKPEKLNLINESLVIISDHQSVVNATPNQEQTGKKPDEIYNIDLNIPTSILFTEEEKISVYNKPEPGAEKVAYIESPAEVIVIKLNGNFAKVKLLPDRAGWILKRSIATQAFNKSCQEKLKQFSPNYLNTAVDLSVSVNIQQNP